MVGGVIKYAVGYDLRDEPDGQRMHNDIQYRGFVQRYKSCFATPSNNPTTTMKER